MSSKAKLNGNLNIHPYVQGHLDQVLIGESNVGKTSIATRAMQDSYEEPQNTVGFSFQNLMKEVPGKGTVKLFMWDTAGQEIYRSLVAMYYSGVHVCIVVYDVGCRESFEKVGDWLDEFQNKYRRRPGEDD